MRVEHVPGLRSLLVLLLVACDPEEAAVLGDFDDVRRVRARCGPARIPPSRPRPRPRLCSAASTLRTPARVPESSHIETAARGEERVLLDVVALEAVEEGEEHRVGDVGREVGEVQVREGVGVERADGLVGVRARNKDREAVDGRCGRWYREVLCLLLLILLLCVVCCYCYCWPDIVVGTGVVFDDIHAILSEPGLSISRCMSICSSRSSLSSYDCRGEDVGVYVVRA